MVEKWREFRPCHRTGVFTWENLYPGYRRYNRVRPASYMKTSIFLRVVRRDLGNRVSPANSDSANLFTSLLPLNPDHVMIHLGDYNCSVFMQSAACGKLHTCNLPAKKSSGSLNRVAASDKDIRFCTLCFYFPTKMIHFNALFCPLKCSVNSKWVSKMLI